MAFGDTGVLDNFNRANEGPPPSANWTDVDNGLVVRDNTVGGGTDSAGNWSNWNVETFGPDCEAFATISGTDGALTVYARLTTHVLATTDGYGVQYYNDELKIYKITNGEGTQLGDAIVQVGDDADAFGIQCVGDQISAYWSEEGGAWASAGVETDSTYSSAGYIGARIHSNSKEMDDFGGGTIAAAAGAPQIIIISSLDLFKALKHSMFLPVIGLMRNPHLTKRQMLNPFNWIKK